MYRLAFCALALAAVAVPVSATQINRNICALGYDKRGFVLDVPKTNDSALMFTILDKPCDGPVLVRFVVTAALEKDSAVTVTLRARCMETGGYTNSCAVGAMMYPLGNVAYLAGNPAFRRETHSYEYVIESQKPGIWKYDLMLNADFGAGNGYVEGRTMVIEAYPDP